ncbi:hypothetical protein F4692_001836 [Nocardioides cavernae]|uniref:EVE domain-containing protein n=1 Tax=Nocardioides cavernae TaxID=1921566 RepID=A0A7Y9KTC9_9ACTN|nr:hypothetical protein [Nocardioides cavernae]NYE36703.1 hypothetical protein [Nocardioides cavernae]
MAAGPALSAGRLGAWLVKARGDEAETQQHLRTGLVHVASRCVRPSYRTGLVAAGQPVLLWISGRVPGLPAGIHARGRTTGRVVDDLMPVDLVPLAAPVVRTALVEHPVLCGLEVLRMPAGSNPSYVTTEQLAALQDLSEELRD